MRVADDINRPNGITIDPDRSTLYVNDWVWRVSGHLQYPARWNFEEPQKLGKFDLKQQTDKGLVVEPMACAVITRAACSPPPLPAGRVFSADRELQATAEMPYDMHHLRTVVFAGPGRKICWWSGAVQSLGFTPLTEGPGIGPSRGDLRIVNGPRASGWRVGWTFCRMQLTAKPLKK